MFQRGYSWGIPARLARISFDAPSVRVPASVAGRPAGQTHPEAVHGREPEVVTDRTSLRPAVSPDGTRLAYFRMDAAGWQVVVASSPDCRDQWAFSPPRSSKSRAIRWTPDGTAIAYIDAPDGVHNIWAQPIHGGRARRLTNFGPGAPIEFFDWSRDGKLLGITRQTNTTDVVRVAGL
jgi:WD40-like Beta Propeller Repeat